MAQIEYIEVKDWAEAEIFKQVETFGLQMIDSGLYSLVYTRPELNYVIKVNREGKVDKGYFEYIKSLTADGMYKPGHGYGSEWKRNPFLPRFESINILMLDGVYFGYIIKMEKLLGRETVENKEKFVHDVNELEKYLYDMNKDASDFYDRDALQNLRRVLETAQLNHQPGELDLHLGNFMMRGNQMVLTDPLA